MSLRPERADEVARRRRMDAPTFEALYEEESPRLFGFLARRVGASLAEDLTAEAFAVAWQRRDSFDPERAAFSSWLYGIALNLLRRHHREEHYQLSTLARTGIDPAATIDESALVDRLDFRAAWPRVAAALESMDEIDRDVLTLFAWAGLSYREIAEALGVPVGTVRSRLSRARGRLEREVTNQAFDSQGGDGG
jgi:RNA polymerase sigma factor (sigma-70 family)